MCLYHTGISNRNMEEDPLSTMTVVYVYHLLQDWSSYRKVFHTLHETGLKAAGQSCSKVTWDFRGAVFQRCASLSENQATLRCLQMEALKITIQFWRSWPLTCPKYAIDCCVVHFIVHLKKHQDYWVNPFLLIVLLYSTNSSLQNANPHNIPVR